MIKNIIFDLGNVIIKFNKNELINKFVCNEEAARFIYDKIMGSPEWALMDLGEITKEQAIEAINKRNNNNYSELTRRFLNDWYKTDIYNRQTIELAKQLKEQGYDLYVLSNIADHIYDYIKDDEFFGLTEGDVISALEHVKKPDEKIYEILLERYNLKPEECLFIDDDDSGRNYETANKIGIQGRRVLPNNAKDIQKMLGEHQIQVELDENKHYGNQKVTKTMSGSQKEMNSLDEGR